MNVFIEILPSAVTLLLGLHIKGSMRKTVTSHNKQVNAVIQWALGQPQIKKSSAPDE